MGKRITASTTVQIPSVHAMNGGGVMPRRSNHSTIRPTTMSGTPKLSTLSHNALLAGLILARSSPHNSPLNHAGAWFSGALHRQCAQCVRGSV